MIVKVKLEPGAFVPTRAHETDAGWDLYAREDFTVPAGGSAVHDTGVHMQIPEGYCGLLVSKSGLNVKHSILSTGLVDAGYSGRTTDTDCRSKLARESSTGQNGGGRNSRRN